MVKMHRRWRDDRQRQEDPLLSDVHPAQPAGICRMPSCKDRMTTRGTATRLSSRRCDFAIGYEKKGIV